MKRCKGAATPSKTMAAFRRTDADSSFSICKRAGGNGRTDARGVKFERAKPKVPYPLIIIIVLDGAMSRIGDEAEFSSRGRRG